MAKVLYCGMADDIITPMLLVPDFTKLYSICLLDEAFSRDDTWEGQKEDMKQILLEGSDINSWHLEVYRKYHSKHPVTHLEDKSEILREEDNGKCWRLKFKYMGRVREIIYFHHTDFLKTWHFSIQDIAHVLSIGATFPIRNAYLNNMLRTRTTADCKYYDQFLSFRGEVCKKERVRENVVHVNRLRDALIASQAGWGFKE